MSCKKCNCPSTIILRKKDYYCNDCFMLSTNHKFRACLGKNKILMPNENVLLCISGGVGSTVLIDLVKYGISLDNTKKLRIIPFVLHLFDDDANAKATAELVLTQCNKYQFDVYMIPISNYVNVHNQLPEANCIPHVDPNEKSQFELMFKSMPPTAAYDFLLKIRRNLFVKYAKLLKCNIVFTAETTSTLAINLLSNIAVGRGPQVQNDIGFLDIRDEKVKLLRPMKDISKEELDYYVHVKQLQPICNGYGTNSSLHSIISSFVCNLQENYQSTISTVCKTADKIGDSNEDKVQEKCLLCESDLHSKDLKMSALEATNISSMVSLGHGQMDHSTELSELFKNDSHSVFPFINKYLCYGCSRNYSEMHKPNLPLHLQKSLNQVP